MENIRSWMLRGLAAPGLALGLAGAAMAQAPDGFSRAVAAFNSGDFATALAGFRQSAAQGNNAALNNLGLMYANGWGVAEDDAEAVRWYRQAADQGNVKAMYALSVMYSSGEGVPQDGALAMSWRLKAAKGGDSSAQQALGTDYRHGLNGVAENPVEAARWHGLAAAQGNLISQKAMAWMYDRGEGVPADAVQSYVWWSRAAARGDSHATTEREKLASRMTPNQLAEGQRRLGSPAR